MCSNDSVSVTKVNFNYGNLFFVYAGLWLGFTPLRLQHVAQLNSTYYCNELSKARVISQRIRSWAGFYLALACITDALALLLSCVFSTCVVLRSTQTATRKIS